MSMRGDAARIVLFGDAGVGKSALAVRLLTRRFIGDYTSDHDLYYKHHFVVNESTQVKVEILDSSATRRTDSGHDVEDRVSWCSAAVVVYSIDDRESFDRAREIMKSVRKERPRLPCLLLANKRDLEHCRAVSRCEGYELMLASLPCQFCEVSAADDYDAIVSLFAALSREAIVQQSRKSPPRRRKSIVHVAKALGTVFSAKSLHKSRPPSPSV